MLNNERGQMAIFVALFFQVLFVFFAMAINVGLVVHDKINLQNSVDIAAYYGATKQAEVLNQIAHINYQMRQNYKLFTWRYRVLGTLGNGNHPLFFSNPAQLAADANSIDAQIFPTVCIAHSFWQEAKDIDTGGFTLCRDPFVRIINVSIPSPGGGIVPGVNDLPVTFQFINEQIRKTCQESSIFNWQFAGRILVHYRVDGLARKRMIQRLAQNLSAAEPLDIRNESIREGVRKTFTFNLTDSNANGIQNFQYFNSMSQGQCSDPNFWLPEIHINPIVRFSDHRVGPSTDCEAPDAVPNRAGSTGRPQIQGLDNLPSAFAEAEFFPVLQRNQILANHWSGEPDPSTGLNSSVGFEKNPWCMVYSGVQATTVVRKPFDPRGGVTLQARAFAKPFGGRIGPWYGKTWPAGNANSQAASRADMVDPLLPSRTVQGAGLGAFDPNQDVANFSRFPGDQFGAGSMQFLSAMAQRWKQTMNFNDSVSDPPPLALANYSHLGGLPNMQQTGDSLARDANVVSARTGATTFVTAKQRLFEAAALAPDVFDALYYSVEPAYHNNYFSPQAANGGPQFSDNEKVFDFGSSKDQNNFPQTFSVRDQVAQSRANYMQNYPHILRDWHHLLTSWHQEGATEYGMDSNQFGRCNLEVRNADLPTTGNCIAGGRTGYAVKLISRDYLNSSNHALGGGSQGAGGAGSILNPPSF